MVDKGAVYEHLKTEVKSKLIEESVLDATPNHVRHRAKLSLSYLNGHLTWNDKGEVMISATLIPHSNIIDLLKSQLMHYKNFHSVGFLELKNLLSNINITVSLLAVARKKNRKVLVRDYLLHPAYPSSSTSTIAKKVAETMSYENYLYILRFYL